MLKSILLKCIPSDLRIEFHRSYSFKESVFVDEDQDSTAHNDDTGSQHSSSSSSTLAFDMDKGVKKLLKFIKREVYSLERSGATVKFSNSSSKVIRTAAGLLTPNEGKRFCIFCKSTEHYSDNCDNKLTVEQRKDILRCEGRCFKCTRWGHTTKKCNSKYIKCRKCNGRHASSMCNPNFRGKDTANIKQNPVHPTTNLCSANSRFSDVYLQTACAYMSSPTNAVKSQILVRVILDSGSQRSYVRESLAQELNLPIVDTIKIRILPFGCSKRVPTQTCNLVRVVLQSLHDNQSVALIAVVVPEICLDTLPIPDISNPKLSQILLADSHKFGCPVKGISLLIGSDFYWKVVSGEYIRVSEKLTALNTKLGWTIQGQQTEDCRNSSFDISTLTIASLCDKDSPSVNVQKIWDLESLGIVEADARKDFLEAEHYIRRVHNRYEASLLWRNNNLTLDSYREGAFCRFKSLVRKLSREPDKLMQYDRAMDELIRSGCAERVEPISLESTRLYYMPHRPVYREDKTTTKLRIVFDASARSTGNSSLNDLLDAGPNLLPDILSILLRFRIGQIALVADIEKAFLQVSLASEDRNVHRFFWFSKAIESPTNLPPVQEYRMTRVTFGVKCSPFLLSAVLQKHLDIESKNYPVICGILKRSFYMDDILLSVDSEDVAENVYEETCIIMKRALMNARKWNSNSLRMRSKIQGDNDNLPDKQMVLGIVWYCLSDEITVYLDRVLEFVPSVFSSATKRNVLQLIARIFDPIGMLAPFTVKLKILFQNLWRIKLPWDETLPKEFMMVWKNCCNELQLLKGLSLPRCIRNSCESVVYQLHVFADASPSAYGAVAYLRTSQKDGYIAVNYLCSKNRISPLKQGGDKQLTLPKLELTAALIAARLKRYLIENLNLDLEKVFLWTDSKITLHWISGDSRKWKEYVVKRVDEIKKYSNPDQWRHCPGVCNPADFLTRGSPGKHLATDSAWINGPSWLLRNVDEWPELPVYDNINESVFLVSLQGSNESNGDNFQEQLLDIERFGCLGRLLRVTAYVQRFVRCIRDKAVISKKYLIAREMKSAEYFWIRHVQRLYYSSELKSIKGDKPVSASSSILSLNPILDVDEILRVGSRLQLLGDYDSAFPIILPRSAYFTKLVVLDVHQRTLHGGISTVLSRLREKFWVPRGRQFIKGIVKGCRVCRRQFGKPATQPFAPLPRSRLVSMKPFETTGIDFAGPLYIKLSKEDTNTKKVYIMLLTCSTVRAVHLELVQDLTVENCLLALRRFIARRGVPKTIISDNARTFKRASREIGVLGKVIFSDEVQVFASNNGVSWEFIVERAPWWGGFWERLIRSMKNILKIVIGRAVLTSDELYTVLTEAESMMNSRPLTYVSDDPLDLAPLTPSHFLQGNLPSSFDITVDKSIASELREKWKLRLKLINYLWKRWRTEYVQLLRSVHHCNRNSSKNCLKEGDVVLVHDQRVPRVLWKLAVIERVYPGRDGNVRACEIRFKDGSRLRRPIQLLYPLELQDN